MINTFFADGSKLADHPDLVLAGEGARIAGVSSAAFQRYAKRGEIEPDAHLSGGQAVYRRADADRLAVKVGRMKPEPVADERDADTQHLGLSIHQPFASMIANGTKRFEFRTWQLKRLPVTLVICASMRKPPKEHADLPIGVTVAVATVYACLPMGGGFAWVFKNVIPLPPVPVRGRQRIFRLSDLTLRRKVATTR